MNPADVKNKRKPQLLLTGKPNLHVQTFIKNLKDNDLHYDNKQITQCVFLGVLKLKPMPNIFHNNSNNHKINNESLKLRNNNSHQAINKNMRRKFKARKELKKKPFLSFNLKTKDENKPLETSIKPKKMTLLPQSILDKFKESNNLDVPQHPVQALFDKMAKAQANSLKFHKEANFSLTRSKLKQQQAKTEPEPFNKKKRYSPEMTERRCSPRLNEIEATEPKTEPKQEVLLDLPNGRKSPVFEEIELEIIEPVEDFLVLDEPVKNPQNDIDKIVEKSSFSPEQDLVKPKEAPIMEENVQVQFTTTIQAKIIRTNGSRISPRNKEVEKKVDIKALESINDLESKVKEINKVTDVTEVTLEATKELNSEIKAAEETKQLEVVKDKELDTVKNIKEEVRHRKKKKPNPTPTTEPPRRGRSKALTLSPKETKPVVTELNEQTKTQSQVVLKRSPRLKAKVEKDSSPVHVMLTRRKLKASFSPTETKPARRAKRKRDSVMETIEAVVRNSFFDNSNKENEGFTPKKENDSVFQQLSNSPSNPLVASKPQAFIEDDDEFDDDDQSKDAWCPDDYAEYKFKYIAKKFNKFTPQFKCKICLKIMPSYYLLNKHKQEHLKAKLPYQCNQCSEAFKNLEDLTAHLRIHKGKHPYTCKKCNKGFWNKHNLEAHAPIHILRKTKQMTKRFRCDVCAKEFYKLCDMERHMRVHTGEKPCVCNICNKRFQQTHNLSKHLLTHLQLKPFHCEICNKQFGRNDVLSRHLLTHSVDKPYKCSLCTKGFIRQSQLDAHNAKHHKTKSLQE